jgi:hypothetical protein
MTQNDFSFMDLLDDDAWFEASVRREETVDCEALALVVQKTFLSLMIDGPGGQNGV